MLLAYEMRCYRNMLGVGWQERKTNGETEISPQTLLPRRFPRFFEVFFWRSIKIIRDRPR